MANIQDNGTHFTYHTDVGSIEDSFFYFTHWYGGNYVLVTLVDGTPAARNEAWLGYLASSGIAHEVMGGACLVMPASTEQLFVDGGTFRGLSEIYVCHKMPGEADIPKAAYPVDRYDFGEDLPDGFLEGVRKLDALVYMSGGRGINIAHKVKGEIIFFVREMSMG